MIHPYGEQIWVKQVLPKQVGTQPIVVVEFDKLNQINQFKGCTNILVVIVPQLSGM